MNMRNQQFLKLGNWPMFFGMIFFTGMMAVGYYYNLTFVQFGLLDLGTRVIGMSEQQVATDMAVLALITSIVAISFGLLMMKRGWSEQFLTKLRMAFGVVLVQTLLTVVAPMVSNEAGFLAWVVVAATGMGVGVPVTFGMTVDLVPVRYRGLVAASITAGAYFPAAVLSATWTIEQFSANLIWVMVAGIIPLGGLAFGDFDLVERLAEQHARPGFGRGRFVGIDDAGHPRVKSSLVLLVVLMFGIFFIDSLGFLRLADTPFFFETAWQSPDLFPRLNIGITHVLAALVAGVLYGALGERELFLWIFGIFALVHLMYTSMARQVGVGEPTLATPILYSIAVSLYTVVNFAIWADVSTPRTISRNTAIGVAMSGFTATFISTALALQMQLAGVPLETHLRIVDALAMLFFLLVLILIFFGPVFRGRKKDRSLKDG
jgi:MFS family permease